MRRDKLTGGEAVNAVSASQLERLLCSGGDTRLDLEPATQRNRYASSPHPCPAVPFGSCTSSTVSTRGYAAAWAAAQELQHAENPSAAAEERFGAVRRRLRELLTLPDEVEVAFAPSGTDVELLALALAAGNSNRPIVNILVGAKEVGSGTPLAAAGKHYDCRTPSGLPVVVGQDIDTALAGRITLKTVDLRSPRGDMLCESEIDAAAIEICIEAFEADAIVLLHVVAHSKTGVHAPSLSCVERLRSISDDLVIVVDAAQGRFSRRGLRDALKNNYLVLFTGSKFYGGPPFSGAILVPPRFHPSECGITALPAGFRDYFTAAEMPESWDGIRDSLPAEANVGLLLRWCAAVAEMGAYYQVPSDLRLQVLRFFETETPRILGASKMIRMMPVFPPLYDDSSHRLLESKTTVFGFWVTPPGARGPMGKEELKRLQFELAEDVSADTSAPERRVLSHRFHIGQPVDLGHAGFVLRVALGGELITRVATDPQIGETFDARLVWLREQLCALRRKIERLAARPISRSSPAPLQYLEVPNPDASLNFPSFAEPLR